MTAQVGEILLIDGDQHEMFNEPLRFWFALSGVPSPFEGISSACWRGYVGTWELTGDRLYLVGLRGHVPDEKPVSIETIFAGWPNRVFAHWYTGTLTVPRGEMLHYVHLGYGRLHEETLFIDVERGAVTGRRRVKNSKPSAGQGQRLEMPAGLGNRPGA
jgi:hypothetical protein